jgi:hypothetical protein
MYVRKDLFCDSTSTSFCLFVGEIGSFFFGNTVKANDINNNSVDHMAVLLHTQPLERRQPHVFVVCFPITMLITSTKQVNNIKTYRPPAVSSFFSLASSFAVAISLEGECATSACDCDSRNAQKKCRLCPR